MSAEEPVGGLPKTFLSFTLSVRDVALFALKDRDLEAQLIAIKSLLRRNAEADRAVSEELRGLDEHIRTYAGDDDDYQRHLEDSWVDALQGSVFQDAAHSMAAVGMLAPCLESLFVGIFQAIRSVNESAQRSDDRRSKAAQDQYWNPQIYIDAKESREDLVAGIAQLSVSTGLPSYLPQDYRKTLAALFGYRNNMFHNGFEWPPEVRTKFATRMKAENWPSDWFEKAETNNQPWIFYMSPSFVEHCLTTIEQVLEGVGSYLNDARAKKG